MRRSRTGARRRHPGPRPCVQDREKRRTDPEDRGGASLTFGHEVRHPPSRAFPPVSVLRGRQTASAQPMLMSSRRQEKTGARRNIECGIDRAVSVAPSACPFKSVARRGSETSPSRPGWRSGFRGVARMPLRPDRCRPEVMCGTAIRRCEPIYRGRARRCACGRAAGCG